MQYQIGNKIKTPKIRYVSKLGFMPVEYELV